MATITAKEKRALVREAEAAGKAELAELQRVLYRKDPLTWVEEVLGEDRSNYEWSLFAEYAEHEWDGTADPLAKAWNCLADGKWVGIEAATGTSKTYWLARVVLWYLDCHPDSLVVTSAPKQDQLKLSLWAEIQKIFNKFRKARPEADLQNLKLLVEGKSEAGDEDEVDLSKSWMAVGFVAGVGAEEQSATRAQGFHREHMLIILEECPGMSRAVLTAFKNTCTGENNLMLAVGNPDDEMDPLHEFCEMDNVDHIRISGYDYPNVVLNKEVFPGAVTNGSIARRKAGYGENSPLYLSRVRGLSPAQSADSLIRLEWIDQCLNRRPTTDSPSFNAVGVDVANSEGGDKAALAFIKDGVLDHVHQFRCPNATHLAYNLAYSSFELSERGYDDYRTRKTADYDILSECIGIDGVGVGVATVNAFTDLPGFGKVKSLQGGQWDEAIPKEESIVDGRMVRKPMYRFVSLRAQMYWELREDLRSGNIGINIADEELLRQIKRELVAPKFDLRASTIAVERKDKIIQRLGSSPNMADAIVYANWVRKGYKKRKGGLPIFGG